MRVLAIGAHPDDIELGCAGALLRHVDSGHRVSMLVMTKGDRGPQGPASRVSEQEAAAELIGAELLWAGYRDGRITQDADTITFLDGVIRHIGADVVYTHAPQDTHQDHVATAFCSIAAARKLTRVLCYQSPTSARFDPMVFVDIEETLDRKLQALGEHRSQLAGCELVDAEAVAAGARFWGHRGRLRLAEAFETPRLVWDISPTTQEYELPRLDRIRESRRQQPYWLEADPVAAGGS
jgi:LmbE family N-acetylglucosaminyl deacetylase